MQIAEQALQLMRDMSASNDEHNFMIAYSSMQVEVEKMRKELIEASGKLNSSVYSKKEGRIDNLAECLVCFNECFFKMMHYKQESVTWKHKALEKELELINFITSEIDK
tara:strand:+ start:38 stop:364 length:327 start_codon:yes stop_codon:yes gene_type:complete